MGSALEYSNLRHPQPRIP